MLKLHGVSFLRVCGWLEPRPEVWVHTLLWLVHFFFLFLNKLLFWWIPGELFCPVDIYGGSSGDQRRMELWRLLTGERTYKVPTKLFWLDVFLLGLEAMGKFAPGSESAGFCVWGFPGFIRELFF